jgi:hypothetical protein
VLRRSSVVFFPVSHWRSAASFWLVFVNYILRSGRVRCDGCGTILPSTDCVRQWISSALLWGTSTVPFCLRWRQLPQKLKLNNDFSWKGWTVGHCHTSPGGSLGTRSRGY